MNLSDFFAELRRRRVFKVTGIYAIVGWLAIQIAATTFPVLMLPEWTVRLVVALFLLGIPVVVVLAWIFDITPEGVERTPRAAAHEAEAAPAAAAAPRRLPGRISAWGVAALLVAALGLTFYRYAPLERGRTDGAAALLPEAEALDRSIAVLPFTDMSEARDQEYFSDGITDDILTRLSRVTGLRVTSRTSVMGYKGTSKNLRQIGEELGVAHILEGSVRRSGDRVRISAQLIDARSDQHLWSESFDRRLDDIFAIQSEIATAIAGALQLRLSAGERSRLERAPTGNLTAYDLYLRAGEYLTPTLSSVAEADANWIQAIALLRQALAEDPTFYLAHVGLARAYLYHPDLRGAERRDSVLVHARRALAGDPDLAEAHAYMAMEHARNGDEEAARREFQRALTMAPNNAEVVGRVALDHGFRGRFDEAIRLFIRAVALDPNTHEWYLWLRNSYMALDDLERAEHWTRRENERFPDPAALHIGLGDIARRSGDLGAAEEHYRVALSSAPDATHLHTRMGNLEIVRGNYEDARQHYARAVASAGRDDIFLMQRAIAASRAGDRAEAEELLRRGETNARRAWEECAGTCANDALAGYHALQGRREEALQYLQRAVEHGWRHIHSYAFMIFGAFDSLADDPRYQRLIAQVQADLDQQRARLRREGL